MIISKVKSCYGKWNYKYGVHVTNSLKESVRIDEENENTLWQYDMYNYITSKRIAFDVREEGESPPRGLKNDNTHDLWRQARRWVQTQVQVFHRQKKDWHKIFNGVCISGMKRNC